MNEHSVVRTRGIVEYRNEGECRPYLLKIQGFDAKPDFYQKVLHLSFKDGIYRGGVEKCPFFLLQMSSFHKTNILDKQPYSNEKYT